MLANHEADVFKAVADPTRRELLMLLRARDHTASELALPFTISQPALSQHLRILREAGLVSVRTEGRHRVYSLEPANLVEFFDWVKYFEDLWRSSLMKFGEILDNTP